MTYCRQPSRGTAVSPGELRTDVPEKGRLLLYHTDLVVTNAGVPLATLGHDKMASKETIKGREAVLRQLSLVCRRYLASYLVYLSG